MEDTNTIISIAAAILCFSSLVFCRCEHTGKPTYGALPYGRHMLSEQAVITGHVHHRSRGLAPRWTQKRVSCGPGLLCGQVGRHRRPTKVNGQHEAGGGTEVGSCRRWRVHHGLSVFPSYQLIKILGLPPSKFA